MKTHVDEARLQSLLDQSRTLHRGVAHDIAPAGLAAAQADDMAMLQTAASLENVAVSTYTAALNLEAVRGGNATVVAFLTTTRNQHADHAAAFNAAVTRAGGMVQTNPDPKYAALVQQAPLTTVADVLTLAVDLEDVATQTFVRAATLAGTPALRSLFVSVAAVEAQHRAILLTVASVLDATPAVAVTLHPDVARLPAATGSIGFPTSTTAVTQASPRDEGALQ
ncbi:MAG TPA: ferritin-like domain-containing protein [Mycobacteriales bacterium]